MKGATYMDNMKIGKLIAKCRKEKKLTQKELAELLGVTDKSVSKWETGVCLPDVSLYKELCNLLGITLNEFFVGERIADENYKKKADENLYNALENSVFTLKDKIKYFKNKWEKEHFFTLIIWMLIIVFFIIYGFIKDNGLQYLFMILGFISGIIENNRKMAYIERNAYGQSSNISINEFNNSIQNLQETKNVIKHFSSKKEAIDYLVRETGIKRSECIKAYDFIMSLDSENFNNN